MTGLVARGDEGKFAAGDPRRGARTARGLRTQNGNVMKNQNISWLYSLVSLGSAAANFGCVRGGKKSMKN